MKMVAMSVSVAHCVQIISPKIFSNSRRQLRVLQTQAFSTQPRLSYGRKYSFTSICQASSSSTNNVSVTTQASPARLPTWEIKMLYDGDCPLCMREVNMLKARDANQNKICFVDVADPDYDPTQHANISFEQAMERIHAVLPDGKIIVDVEVFRRLYEAVGLGWVYAITKIPFVLRAANVVYDIWAKYRLPITGRPDLAVVLQEKKTCKSSK